MRRFVVAVLAAFALVGASACGEEDGGSLRAELAAELREDEGLSEEDADCVAGELIDDLGGSQVRAYMEMDDEAVGDDLDFEEMMEVIEAGQEAYAACGVDMFGGDFDFEDIPDVEDFDVDVDVDFDF